MGMVAIKKEVPPTGGAQDADNLAQSSTPAAVSPVLGVKAHCFALRSLPRSVEQC